MSIGNGQHSVEIDASVDPWRVIAIIFKPLRSAFRAISISDCVSPDLLISTSVPFDTRVSWCMSFKIRCGRLASDKKRDR